MLIKLKQTFVIILALWATVAWAKPSSINAGTQYQPLAKQINDVPPVIEFFSFYCGPCYLFAEKYHVDNTISQALPNGIKLTKYHVGVMGPLGQELTTAWSIASVLELQNKVEALLFSQLRAGKLKSVDDIKAIFATFDVTPERYDALRQSPEVNALIEKQNQAIVDFNVTSTPSFYVLGKYHVNNNGVSDKTLEGFPKELANIIVQLLNK